MTGILAVAGLANTTAEFRAELAAMAARHGWDVDAIAAVISLESGFNAQAKNPASTASGLIQFLDSTARSLGMPGGAAQVRQLSAVEQLPLVEKYYSRAFASLPSPPRKVDYYLAVLGPGLGRPMTHVLWSAEDPKSYANNTKNAYGLNKGLDVDDTGTITVSDIAAKVERVQARAKGVRLEAGPLEAPPAGGTLYSLAELPLLSRGSRGSAVRLWQRWLYVADDGVFGPVTESATKLWQSGKRLPPSGKVGPDEWRALRF